MPHSKLYCCGAVADAEAPKNVVLRLLKGTEAQVQAAISSESEKEILQRKSAKDIMLFLINNCEDNAPYGTLVKMLKDITKVLKKFAKKSKSAATKAVVNKVLSLVAWMLTRLDDCKCTSETCTECKCTSKTCTEYKSLLSEMRQKLEEEARILENEILCWQNGFGGSLLNVPGDGACFIYSVMVGLQSEEPICKSPADLMRTVVLEMANNSAKIIAITDDEREGLGEHLESYMNGVYAKNPILDYLPLFLSSITKRPLRILHRFNETLLIESIYEAENIKYPEQKCKNMLSVFLDTERGHFLSFLPASFPESEKEAATMYAQSLKIGACQDELDCTGTSAEKLQEIVNNSLSLPTSAET